MKETAHKTQKKKRLIQARSEKYFVIGSRVRFYPNEPPFSGDKRIQINVFVLDQEL